MRIAVVGAGIAGLAMGFALDRAALPYQIYEQATELREVGAGLQLAPNATRLLRRFGLAHRLKETAVRPEFLELRRWDTGAVLGRTILGDECEVLFGEPYYLVHRADLQRAMIDLLPEGRVRLAARCVGVRDRRWGAGGVRRRFSGAVRRCNRRGRHSLRRTRVAGAR